MQSRISAFEVRRGLVSTVVGGSRKTEARFEENSRNVGIFGAQQRGWSRAGTAPDTHVSKKLGPCKAERWLRVSRRTWHRDARGPALCELTCLGGMTEGGRNA